MALSLLFPRAFPPGPAHGGPPGPARRRSCPIL